MEFITWEFLGSFAGAMGMVGVVTELTKGAKWLSKIPTQLWSYLIAVVTLVLANYFLGQLTAANVVLMFFNAGLVSLASNGGYEVINRIFNKE